MNERERIMAARLSPCCTQYGREQGRDEKDQNPEGEKDGQLNLIEPRSNDFAETDPEE